MFFLALLAITPVGTGDRRAEYRAGHLGQPVSWRDHLNPARALAAGGCALRGRVPPRTEGGQR
jgi:hypothetical protein